MIPSLEKRLDNLTIIDREQVSEIPKMEDLQKFLTKQQQPPSQLLKELQRVGSNEENKNCVSKIKNLNTCSMAASKMSPSHLDDMNLILTFESNGQRKDKFPNPSNTLHVAQNDKKLLCSLLSPSMPLNTFTSPPTKRCKLLRSGSADPSSLLSFSSSNVIIKQRFLSVKEVYKIKSRLGVGRYIYIYIILYYIGGFGIVYKVKHRQTNEIRAMKKIDKSLYPANVDPGVEYKILKSLDHPNIMRLIEYWESPIISI